MRRGDRSSHWLLAMAVGCVAGGVLFAAASWWAIHSLTDLDAALEVAIVGAVAAISVPVGAVFAQPLFGRWLDERGQRATALPPGLSLDQIEEWRTFVRKAVVAQRIGDEHSQLNQMVRQGTTIDVNVKDRVSVLVGDDGRSRLEVRGRAVAWSEIVRAWDEAPHQMVILGEPGYGKTVAALTLLNHINAKAVARGPVAELFPLAEWYGWQLAGGQGGIGEWLVHQLSRACRVRREGPRALVESGLVLPIFDGLDEVPESHRAQCLAAIVAYAGKAPPFAPFILTCRAREYRHIALDWIPPDRQVGLIGLDRGQIASVITQQTHGRGGWAAIRDGVAAGDDRLTAVLRSPLRLAVALRVYDDRDPRELLELPAGGVERHLWDLLLDHEGGTFRDASREQVRAWLEHFAGAIRQRARQRFWLHELYEITPDEDGLRRRFATMLATAVSLGILILAFPLGGFSDFVPWVLAVVTPVAVMSWPAVRSLDPRALSVGVPVDWRTRGLHVVEQRSVVLGSGFLCGWLFVPAIAIDRGVVTAVLAGAGGLVCGVLGAIAYLFVTAGRTVVAPAAEPPRRLVGRGPGAVLRASRNAGLKMTAVGIGFGALSGLAVALLFDAADGGGLDLGFTLEFALRYLIPLGIIAGALVVGAGYGLRPWLYHHWLRARLARDGLLPRRLEEFLDWCALPERGWIRATDAYEFLHRDLLDHLGSPERPRRFTPGSSTAAAEVRSRQRA